MPDFRRDSPSECAPVHLLAECLPGDCVRVSAVLGEADVQRRLLEMGLTPGALVRVVRVAPLGDPMELAIRGYRLSVRRGEAQYVVIQRDPRHPTSFAATGAAAAGGC